jgi:hypothetical protein
MGTGAHPGERRPTAGLYELRLNGQRVGDQILAPKWTNYRTRVQYRTHDVTIRSSYTGLHGGGRIVGVCSQTVGHRRLPRRQRG